MKDPSRIRSKVPITYAIELLRGVEETRENILSEGL